MSQSASQSLEVGVAIAGGGVSGAAAVGVLQALEEAGIRVSHLAGTSSGAVVAALYASGYHPDQLRSLIPVLSKKQLDYDRRGILMRVLKRRRFIDGFIKGHRLYNLFREFTKGAYFSAVQLPVAVVATELRSGKPAVFTQSANIERLKQEDIITIPDAAIADALRASCAIPVVFQPVRYHGHVLVDGGVVMNCPVEIVRRMGASYVLAVDTVTAFANETIGELPSALSIFSHVINLSLRNQMHFQHQSADAVYHPHVGPVGAFDFHQIDNCVDRGYTYAKDRMPELLESLRALQS